MAKEQKVKHIAATLYNYRDSGFHTFMDRAEELIREYARNRCTYLMESWGMDEERFESEMPPMP